MEAAIDGGERERVAGGFAPHAAWTPFTLRTSSPAGIVEDRLAEPARRQWRHVTAEHMDLNAWKAQLRKGAAELAVLATLDRKESYGIEVLEEIHRAGGLELSEGSIYPLLNRLQKEGKIVGQWVDDPDANHPRKYYALTPAGRRLLREMLAEWSLFEAGMREILGAELERAPA
jgi:PadR family transcriptional regulator PadR